MRCPRAVRPRGLLLPATFDLTFTAVHGSIPVTAAKFTITDELGHLHHPQVSVMGGGPTPATLPAGHPSTLVIHTTLPIGNGRLDFTPMESRPLVAGDFDVETD